MLTKEELLQAIAEVKERPASYSNCKMLATFYTLLDRLYPVSNTQLQTVGAIGKYGDSEFLQSIAGQPSEKVFQVLDELMEALKTLNPKLYNNVIQRL